jgi:hypothetical protein
VIVTGMKYPMRVRINWIAQMMEDTLVNFWQVRHCGNQSFQKFSKEEGLSGSPQ